MEFRVAKEEDFNAIRTLLVENGWEKRVADAERFRRMMVNADRTVVVLDGERLVGFARALCDDASNGYIGTVAVVEDMRGTGVGREMIMRLMGDDPDITWSLNAGRGSEGFWQKMGFTKSAVAMTRPRSADR